MKKIILTFISALYFTLNAQDNYQLMSNAEKFSKSPGKIIKTSVVYNNRYSSAFGGYYAYISLNRFSELNGNETIYGLKFYGYIDHAKDANLTVMENYAILLDYDDLVKIISWMELIKSDSVDIDQISYISQKSDLLLKYYKNGFDAQYNKSNIYLLHYKGIFDLEDSKTIFEVQYNKFDENSISVLGRKQFDNLYNDLIEIRKLWPKTTE